MLAEICLGLLLLLLFWKTLGRPINYPPGYWGLPLVGYLPLTRRSLEHNTLMLHKKYGDIASWRIGTKLMVFVYDYKLMKDLLGHEAFINRPVSILFRIFAKDQKNLGLVGSNELQWHNSRRFSLRLLRDLGMGKSRIVSAVQHEASLLVADVKGMAGKPINIKHHLVVAVGNIIWQMVASTRYGKDDEELLLFEELFNSLQKLIMWMVIPEFLPWLQKILPKRVRSRLFEGERKDELLTSFDNFMKKIIYEHQSNLDPDDPKDYIDHYLVEMKNQEDKKDSTMSIDDLSACIKDLFSAGSETTSSMLTFSLYYLANYPEVQKRLQEEIDKVLPKGTLVTLEDKEKLSYVEAVIQEVQRKVSLAKFGVWREASEDIAVGRYVIPKGAYLNPHIEFSHHDSRYWKSPENFQPERFLDEKGKVSIPKEGFLPFGSGKRQCLGEALARVELFIFLTTIMQNFSVSPPPGTKSVNVNPNPDNPMFNFPFEEEVTFTAR